VAGRGCPCRCPTPEDLRDYQREHAISIALTLDESGELFRRFRVMHVPTVVLVQVEVA
jgi:hypothetical protein